MNFTDIMRKSGEFEKLTDAIKKGKTPVHVRGPAESAKAHTMAAALSNCGKRNMLVIASDDFEAQNLYADLQFFLGDDVLLFPSRDYIFYNAYAGGNESGYKRITAAYRLLSGNCSVVASVASVIGYTIDLETLAKHTLELELGKAYDVEQITEDLIFMGYERNEQTEAVGQFSLRGGILDVFSPQSDAPFRIEFFDDEVDSIREYDPESQLSTQKEDVCRILPCRELLYDSDTAETVAKQIEKTVGKYHPDADSDLGYHCDADNFREKHYFPSNDKYIGYFYKEIPTLLQYCGENTLVWVDEPKNTSEIAKKYELALQQEIADLQEKQVVMPETRPMYASWEQVISAVAKTNALAGISALSHHTPDYSPKEILLFDARILPSFHGKIEFLLDDLHEYARTGTTVAVVTSSRAKAKNICEAIVESGLSASVSEQGEFTEGAITVMVGGLKKGFYYPAIPFCVISDTDVFLEKKRKRAKTPENTKRLQSYNEINPGDYVVHQTHGIGQYEGIVQLKLDGKVKKDFLKIRYNGSDVLYIPPDQLSALYKYVGNTDRTIRLNKLGGTDWARTKQRVKAATKDLADYLIKLYSERQKAVGYAFSKDTVWQRQFEDTFLYQETDDQLRCIAEVKADMETPRPMDRLLCGDVGYGKTEVALRAAFKAVMDSKQVAYLVPTTVLAMQHFNTFTERMKDFPITVEMMSRFKTAKQQKDILKRLKTGEVDIVIGTHRILQKDLKFKDLGLLIVDEEQRFGVEHKEKYKELKTGIDVLTLSATPIPRTLHMSMVNIRDMSVLEQPPEARYPVQTYVVEYDAGMICDAIKKEVARGGQVYYLYNRVAGIYNVAERLRAVLPDVNIAVGHGQMGEDGLEDVMMGVVSGETDVLVCTTIIETGLDIPNVNTIIIEDADKMGLSQLYQLRGRVGRSNKRAYAYFTYRKDKVLTEIAEKRLLAIREFTQFGSGFKIAMRDLEIRGAGNLLGAQQHGHIDAVGYDTYCQILRESIDEERGVVTKPIEPAVIDVNADAYIPESYVRGSRLRVDTYKKIAAVESQDERMDLEDELIDRFGDIPVPVANLMDIVVMKAEATALGFTSILQKDNVVSFRFDEGRMDGAALIALCGRYSSAMRLYSGKNSYFTLKLSEKDAKDPISHITVLLQFMNELKTGDQ
jgi:transcription-repair coupling factor (superfamily II helicase)